MMTLDHHAFSIHRNLSLSIITKVFITFSPVSIYSFSIIFCYHNLTHYHDSLNNNVAPSVSRKLEYFHANYNDVRAASISSYKVCTHFIDNCRFFMQIECILFFLKYGLILILTYFHIIHLFHNSK